MKLTDTMIWWNSTAEQDDPQLPMVMVLGRGSKENYRFDYLSNSIGACFLGWEKADPVLLATHIFAIFAQMVGKDGVPAEQAQNQLMMIDEYREWVNEERGPFADAYRAWAGKGPPWDED